MIRLFTRRRADELAQAHGDARIADIHRLANAQLAEQETVIAELRQDLDDARTRLAHAHDTSHIDLAVRRARIEQALKEVQAVADDGPKRWRCSTPGRPGYDTDSIINAALYDAQRLAHDVERLREVLTEVLGHFTQKGHPGEPCVRTAWIPEKWIARWREAAGHRHQMHAESTAAAVAHVDAERVEPKQFEVWEFDDGKIGRFSWAKDPSGDLALAACSESYPYGLIWAPWLREDNTRQPLEKVGETERRPGEVSRPHGQESGR